VSKINANYLSWLTSDAQMLSQQERTSRSTLSIDHNFFENSQVQRNYIPNILPGASNR
jgi:hypothetical protein